MATAVPFFTSTFTFWALMSPWMISSSSVKLAASKDLVIFKWAYHVANVTLSKRTPGHPEAHDTPGVEVTTGPLGQGNV